MMSAAASCAVGGGYSASVSPTAEGDFGSGALSSGSVTCTVLGGVGPFTYSWNKVSGDTLTIGSSTSASTTFSGTPGGGSQLIGVYRCTVTDTGNSNAIANSNNVTITLTDIGP